MRRIEARGVPMRRIEARGVPMRSEVHVYIVLVYSQAPKVCLRCSTDPSNGKQMSQRCFMAFLDSSTGRPGMGPMMIGAGVKS